MRFLFLESHFGGSHQQFAQSLKHYSSHIIEIVALPAESWKRRLRYGAVEFIGALKTLLPSLTCSGRFDGIIITSLLDCSDLKSLWNLVIPFHPLPPIFMYWHESQLTYPTPPPKQPETPIVTLSNGTASCEVSKRVENYDLEWKDLISALVADVVVFGSQYHKRAFLDAVRHLVNSSQSISSTQQLGSFQLGSTHQRPQNSGIVDIGGSLLVPSSSVLTLSWLIPAIETKLAKVPCIYMGVPFTPSQDIIISNDFPACETSKLDSVVNVDPSALLILWTHRWEYDKDPASFFDALYALERGNCHFQVCILGFTNQVVPKPFLRAKIALKHRIVQFGPPCSQQEYINWLRMGDVVVSTALQETFGVSVVEAIHEGCYPLLPNRLSYPELLPRSFYKHCLYDDLADLIQKLKMLSMSKQRSSEGHVLKLRQKPSFEGEDSSILVKYVEENFSWAYVISQYDELLSQMVVEHSRKNDSSLTENTEVANM